MNTKVVFGISAAVAAWGIYDLTNPGETPSTAVFIMNCLVVLFGLAGAIGAVMKMQKANS
jgi:hypothetical protein